ncbi:hypothetical protein V5F79_22790 [Xanthobacter flavus]|uniref:hypothetical protein n=1 Tax=Xanthobacter flavus TaxID=281 RepID=UPI00372C436C
MNQVNVLSKIADFSRNATTAVVLTHNIDFVFAQAILVSRLRRAGAPRLTIFADAGCAAGSYGRQSEMATLVGRAFRVVPVDLGGMRRFHPKAIFLAGPTGASLAVGSGNLTQGGWSGNREIWTYFDFPRGDGGPPIAAFRDYLSEVCDISGLTDVVKQTVLEPFKAEEWALTLPEPGGLLTLPADTTLMDQLFGQLHGKPSSFDVLAPYHDAEGSAAAEMARRMDAPTRVLVQHGKVGLSASAAAALPPNARVIGVTPPGKSRQTIHAKLYAARYSNEVVLIAGSANCSRAALLSRRDGNAELMAVSRLSPASYEELLNGIDISTEPPDLPATAPNDDFDAIDAPPVRILSASYEIGTLTLHCAFSNQPAPARLTIFLESGRYTGHLNSAGRFVLDVAEPGGRVLVELATTDGLVRSAPMWIDHEAELRIGQAEHGVQAKLASNAGLISSDGLVEIFTLMIEHINSPIPWSRHSNRLRPTTAVEYDLADVFSDGFGRRSYATVPGGGYLITDEWTLMNDYFRVCSPDHKKHGQPRMDGDVPGEDDEPPEPIPPHAPSRPLDEANANKLSKLVDRAVSAMSTLEFLESRPPLRLSHDIGTVSLLLAIARKRGLSEARLDTASAKLFHALFVGGEAGRALLDIYVEKYPEAPGVMKSAQLTAAMTLWISQLVNKPAAGDWFEFAATRLAATQPWLAQGTEDTLEALQHLSVYIDSLAEALPAYWVSWVQGGAAVRALMDTLKDPTELLNTITRSRIYKGEIVWIGQQFAVALADFERSGNAEFFLLHAARKGKYKCKMTVPLADIIDRMELPSKVVETLKRILIPKGYRGATHQAPRHPHLPPNHHRQ